MSKKPNSNKYNGPGSMTYDAERCRYFYRFYYTNRLGERKRKCVGGLSESECLEKAEEFLRRVSLPDDLAKITIPDLLLDKYEKSFQMNEISQSTMLRKLYTIEIIEKGGLGDTPIVDITESQVLSFLYWLKKYSNSDIEKTYGAIKQAYQMAVTKGILTKNNFELFGISKPRSDKPNKKVRAFEKNERELFLKTLRECKVPKGRNDYRLQLEIAIFTGMRIGEINALKPGDIDLVNGVVHVERTITRDLHRNPIVGSTAKTDNGVRDIQVLPHALKLLERALGQMGNNPEGLVFYDYNEGRPIATQNVNSFFHRVCKKAGLPCYGQHMLRHTFATTCIESGVPINVVSAWLGHSNVKITWDTYTDALNRFQSDSLQKLENYVYDIFSED